MKKLMMSLIAGSAVLTLFAQVRHSEPQIPVRPTLEEEGSFSMILIPDPQSQIKFAAIRTDDGVGRSKYRSAANSGRTVHR